MTNRKPGWRPPLWLIVVSAAGWLAVVWFFDGFNIVKAAEARRGAAPTDEMVQHCENGGSALCARSEPVSVDLTRERRWELERVHSVGRSQISDRCDCDCFVVQAIEALARYGWPAGSMAWGSGWTAKGVHHAWLIVRTSDGEIVLDARLNHIAFAADVVEYSKVKACDWVDVRANEMECWR